MVLQQMSDYSSAVQNKFRGDGCGLSSGKAIEMLILELFKEALRKDFEECHEGEADLSLFGTKVSFKKINGSSEIALSWSRNDGIQKEGNRKNKEPRTTFTCPILIMNLKTSQWWKNGPRYPSKLETQSCTEWSKAKADHVEFYTRVIPAGFYFIDNFACRNIKLGRNNKTNTVIHRTDVYSLLQGSLKSGLYIPLPKPCRKYVWSMTRGIQPIK